MAFACRVECDSISPDGVRLTTLVCTYPRWMHDQVLTHRVLSRNSASSRAVPLWKRIQAVCDDPYVPERFGAEKPGMQAGETLAGDDHVRAAAQWRHARDDAVTRAALMLSEGDRQAAFAKLRGRAADLVALQLRAPDAPSVSVHKSWLNRLLEPFSWHTAVISGTDWANFFAQRCHPDAQPEFRTIAEMMRDAMADSTPDQEGYGDWHLPFVGGEDYELNAHDDAVSEAEYWRVLRLVSVGRCARVSYLTMDGKRDHAEDVALAERLMAATPKHASPFEHVATPARPGEPVRGNFRGWHQFRHQIPQESVPG